MDESNVEEKKLTQNHQFVDEEDQRVPKTKKGGFKTIPFILANEAFEKVASFGLSGNMIVYLTSDYRMSVGNAQNLLYFWNTTASFTPFVGAILADSLFGRFLTIGFGSIFSLLGMFVLWLTTIIPQAKPPQCEPLSSTCSSPTTGQYAFLVAAFMLMAVGGGGTKPCSQPFGADQVCQDDHNDRKSKNNLEIFLNWYYMFSCLSIIVAMTVIVYIQDNLGWILGFGVPVVLMFLATLFFFLAAPFYLMVDPNKNLLVGLAQVVVACFRNRNMSAFDHGSDALYFQGTDSSVSIPSDKLRFLNVACTIRDPDNDIGPDGLPRDPWRLCKVEDVEAIKSFIRLIPIWSTGIMISVNTSLSSFSVLLTRTLDRHIGPNFEVPAASFGTLIIVVIGIWIPLYYRVILPLASKIKGRPVTVSVKARMGIGLFCSFMSILSSGMVETIRRRRAIEQGFEDDPLAVIQMSALWTLPHSIFGGIAEAFFVIGQTEFFFTELPKSMLSIAGSIFGLSGTLGTVAASLILAAVNGLTKGGGNGDGWISDNVNKGHYDYYYYLVGGLNLVNIVFYVYCSEIRKSFLQKGPYTWHTTKYPSAGNGRHFCSSWFKQFPGWLEYSPTTDAAYCLPCFLYAKPSSRQRENAFTTQGFRSWKKVNGKDCAFLSHIGRDHTSAHKDAVKRCNDLMKMEQHIDTMIDNITPEIIERNRLKLKVSIVAVRWLTFQHCAFRGHDESVGSLNRGNFLEFIQTVASFSKDVEKVVLENAPGNASYTSHQIQQEILSIYSCRIRDVIRNEIGDQKYCIIVDETKDVSKREQMSVVLRFVDKHGDVQERLFDLIHVTETTALYLKGAIEKCLRAHKLNIDNIRGQGYDGASNMRGEWSGLQALFLNECPYAYYVHCFAHRLQLALIAASRDVISLCKFLSKLTFIVNIITSSAKRHDQLQAAHLAEIERLIELEELETGKGLNQLGTVKRAGDTRWGSHLGSLTSFLNMYNASCSVLQTVIKEGKGAQRGEADKAYDDMTSFEFVLVLHVMILILRITNDLCQALQRKSQDILNAMHLVCNTKMLLQKQRDDGWENLLQEVLLFCNNHEIEVPNMDDHYIHGGGRFRQPKHRISNLHYFHYEVFNAAIDSQLYELDYRFNDDMIELLSLSSSLDPKRKFQNFKADDIHKLVSKFYPADFTEQEKLNLQYQLDLFLLEMKEHPQLDRLKSISDLCRWLAETKKREIYYLIDRLIRLVLTLPVSTATAERAFSAMKLIKTALRNRMEDDYLTDSLIVYVEKGIAKEFDIDSIIDDFASKKNRRSLLKISKTKE